MLDHLDTFLAFGAVMLGVSLFVTAITQVFSGLANARGKELVAGLERLLKHTAPQLKDGARLTAEAIALHPLISDSATKPNGRSRRFASALRQGELIQLLGSGVFWAETGRWWLEKQLEKKKQTSALANLAELSPSQWRSRWTEALNATNRQHALKDLVKNAAKDVAENNAKEWGEKLAQFMDAEGQSGLVKKDIEAWFNSAMDRTSQRFAVKMRTLTIIASALVAIVLRFDSFAVLQQLSDDPELRARVTAQVEVLNRDFEAAGSPKGDLEQRLKTLEGSSASLGKLGFQLVPKQWTRPSFKESMGILASILLLSLGAPFWFNLLRQLSNLRPIVANLEQSERKTARGEAGKQ